MFALRNKGGKPAVEVLVEVFKARSALIKHEVAYVLGQVGHGLGKGWARLGGMGSGLDRVGQLGAQTSLNGCALTFV